MRGAFTVAFEKRSISRRLNGEILLVFFVGQSSRDLHMLLLILQFLVSNPATFASVQHQARFGFDCLALMSPCLLWQMLCEHSFMMWEIIHVEVQGPPSIDAGSGATKR